MGRKYKKPKPSTCVNPTKCLFLQFCLHSMHIAIYVPCSSTSSVFCDASFTWIEKCKYKVFSNFRWKYIWHAIFLSLFSLAFLQQFPTSNFQPVHIVSASASDSQELEIAAVLLMSVKEAGLSSHFANSPLSTLNFTGLFTRRNTKYILKKKQFARKQTLLMRKSIWSAYIHQFYMHRKKHDIIPHRYQEYKHTYMSTTPVMHKAH